MSDIFVGYAREDHQKIKPLIAALTGLGWSVFWDRNLLPAVEFDQVLETELSQARVAIICWSLHAAESKWVRRETAFADELDILIPVKLTDDFNIPLLLKNTHFLRLVDWTGDPEDPDFLQLVGHLEKRLGIPEGRQSPAPEKRPAPVISSAPGIQPAPALPSAAALPPAPPVQSAPASPPPPTPQTIVRLSDFAPTAFRKQPSPAQADHLITTDDLLEPVLIRLPYRLDADKFFDGRLSGQPGKEDNSYLLPLTPRFFELFVTDGLGENDAQKPRFRMNWLPGGEISAVITIPGIDNSATIVFDRTYRSNIQDHPFSLAIFPFIRAKPGQVPSSYWIHAAELEPHEEAFFYSVLRFFVFGSTRPLPVRPPKELYAPKYFPDAPGVLPSYSIVEKEFDYIRVETLYQQSARGTILPKWPVIQPSKKKFSFAIDHGAISTHIEYIIDGNGYCQPFSIGRDEVQVATLFTPSLSADDPESPGALPFRHLIDVDFIPLLLGPGGTARFPQRTLIAEDAENRPDTTTQVLADLHIPFAIDSISTGDSITRYFAWGDRNPGRDKRLKAFFEILILLIKSKVLFNGGDLRATRIVCSFPSNMKPGRRSDLLKYWKDLCEKHLGGGIDLQAIPAALGVFYYYRAQNKFPLSPNKPVIAIDIGGPHTDLALMESNYPKYLSTIQFGAEALFGDGPPPSRSLSNGILKKYLPWFERLFLIHKLPHLEEVLRLRNYTGNSEEVSSFLFSLEKQPGLNDTDSFSLSALLTADDDCKVVFLYFYAAIIWHLARLVDQKKMDNPGHLVFSGAGAGVLNLLTSDLGILARYSSLFFTPRPANRGVPHINILMEPGHLKEVTAKGMLLANKSEIPAPVYFDGIWVAPTTIGTTSMAELADGQLAPVKDTLIKKIVAFNTFFVGLNQQYDYSDHFNVTPASWQILKREINVGIEGALEEYVQFNLDNKPMGRELTGLEDTLFFFAVAKTIVRVLNLIVGEQPPR